MIILFFQLLSCIQWFCHPMDCKAPVHGILLARILEGVAIFSTRGSSWPRDWICVSCIGRQLYHWATWEVWCCIMYVKICFMTSVQFSSVPQSCTTLCDPMDCSMLGFPVHHQLPEPTQTHVHWVGDPIEPSHPLLSPSPPAFNLSQHQGHFQWVSSLHQVAKGLEFQPQHQSFQWIFRTDFL